MKKLIAFLFLIVLFSCEKPEKEVICWTCTLYSYYGNVISIRDYCDMTVQEVLAKEKYWRELGSLYECVRR